MVQQEVIERKRVEAMRLVQNPEAIKYLDQVRRVLTKLGPSTYISTVDDDLEEGSFAGSTPFHTNGYKPIFFRSANHKIALPDTGRALIFGFDAELWLMEGKRETTDITAYQLLRPIAVYGDERGAISGLLTGEQVKPIVKAVFNPGKNKTGLYQGNKQVYKWQNTTSDMPFASGLESFVRDVFNHNAHSPKGFYVREMLIEISENFFR